MRICPRNALALPTLGLLTVALAGCHSESPTAEFDATPAPPVAASSLTPAGDNAPVPAPALPVPPEPTPVVAAAPAAGAVDEHVRQTGRKLETPATAPAPAADAADSALPALIEPAVEAVKGEANAAAGAVGDGVKQVGEGVKQGVRQAADEVTRGVRQKADGLTQGLRKAADDLSEKARSETHKAAADLLNGIDAKARSAAKNGLNKATDAVESAVGRPTTPPAPKN